jgi:hypothetical protein
MATKLVQTYVGERLHQEGRVINVYDTYANAIAHAATGLVTGCYTVDKLDSTDEDAVTQAAKVTGFEVDQNGMVHMKIPTTTTECFLMSDGQFGPPRRINNP